MTNSHFHAGVAVMIIKDGNVLLAKRKKSPCKDEYSFPGGHLEGGESFVACARRETREECAIEIENVEFLCAGNVTRFPPEQYFHIGFRADWKNGEVVTTEPDTHSEWTWYPLDSLPKPLSIFTAITLDARISGKRFFDEL